MSEYFAYGIHYATSVLDMDLPAIPQLQAGDTPQFVSSDVLYPAGAVAQFVPLTTGYVPWTPGNPIIALTAYAVPGGTRATAIQAGMFNIDYVQFPVGTLESQVQAATENTQVKFRKFLYSNRRTGNEILGTYAGEKPTLPFTPPPGTLTTQAAGALSGRSFTVTGAVGAVVYKAETALPAGTSINASTGAWTGNIAAGTHTFMVSARDSAGNLGIGQYTIVVT